MIPSIRRSFNLYSPFRFLIFSRSVILGAGEKIIRPPNREAIRLYRDILRTCKKFNFYAPNSDELMSEVLKNSARMEFENNRFMTDGEEIARAIFMGYSAVDEVNHRFEMAQKRLLQGAKLAGIESENLQELMNPAPEIGSHSPRFDEDAAIKERKRKADQPANIIEMEGETPYSVSQRAKKDGEE